MTVVTSRRRQRELLAAWAPWSLTQVLADPGELAKVRDGGCVGTHHRDPETGLRSVGTADGLGFGVDDGWRNPVEVIPWDEITTIAEAVPDDVRAQLADWTARFREHRRTYPQFRASAAAAGCGPIVRGKPVTPRQEAYVREWDAFQTSGVLSAWQARSDAMEAERSQLHQLALGEPVDLFDLVDTEQGSGRALIVPALRPPAQTPTGGHPVPTAASSAVVVVEAR